MKITPEDAHDLLLSKGFTVYDYNCDCSNVYYAFGEVGLCLFTVNDIKNDEVTQITFYEMIPVIDSNRVNFRRNKRFDEYNPTKNQL